jgi:hypothetical protein
MDENKGISLKVYAECKMALRRWAQRRKIENSGVADANNGAQ